MKLKKIIFASLTAVTIFSTGAAITACHSTETVQAAKREGKKQKAKYQSWVRNYKKSNIVAIRNTKPYKKHTNAFYNVSSEHYKKGLALPLYDRIFPNKIALTYHKGHYYIRIKDGLNTCELKASDFKYEKFDKTYNKKVNYIKRHTDPDEQVKITTNKPFYGFYGIGAHKSKKFPAHQAKILSYPLLLKNGQGKYVLTASSNGYDGYDFQILYSSIIKFQKVGKYVFGR